MTGSLVDGSRGGVRSTFRGLLAARDLVWMWTLREIRVRYRQSLLGVAWAMVQPLALMIVFTIVFSIFRRMPVASETPYTVFAYTGLLAWSFLTNALSLGVMSLVNNLDLVTKTAFPREILPIGSVNASFFDMMVASSMLLGLMVFHGLPLQATMLWIPLILAVQYLLVLGLALLLSALIVLYRDIRFVVPLALQVGLFISPVIYDLSYVPEHYRTLYMLNPMAGIITSLRSVLLEGQPPELWQLGPAVLIGFVICCGGYGVFKRLECVFADLI